MKVPFKIGELIYLKQPATEHQHEMNYKSRIADVSDVNLSIEVPISEHGGKYGFFPEGYTVQATYPSSDGAQFIFECTILGRRKERVPLVNISYPDPNTIKRVQRRNYLRVPCHVDLAIHPTVHNQFPPLVAIATNVSGGGLLFESKIKSFIEEKMEVSWWLSLPMRSGEILHPTGTGKIVRKIPPAETGLPYKYSVEFTDILEKDRETIIKYCFDRQLEIKRKQT